MANQVTTKISISADESRVLAAFSRLTGLSIQSIVENNNDCVALDFQSTIASDINLSQLGYIGFNPYYDGCSTLEITSKWNSPLEILEKWISNEKLTATIKALDEGLCFWFVNEYQNGLISSAKDRDEVDLVALKEEFLGV